MIAKPTTFRGAEPSWRYGRDLRWLLKELFHLSPKVGKVSKRIEVEITFQGKYLHDKENNCTIPFRKRKQ